MKNEFTIEKYGQWYFEKGTNLGIRVDHDKDAGEEVVTTCFRHMPGTDDAPGVWRSQKEGGKVGKMFMESSTHGWLALSLPSGRTTRISVNAGHYGNDGASTDDAEKVSLQTENEKLRQRIKALEAQGVNQ